MTDKIEFPFIGAMSDKDYFAYPAWDQTQLKQWLVSPAQWAADKDIQPTQAMRFGMAAHALVLGSGAPVKQAEHSPRSKAGQAEQAEADKQGVTLLPADQFEAVHKMAEITRPVFQTLGGRPETAMIAKDPKTGLTIKGKADWLPAKADEDGRYWIYDYKTTAAPLDDFEHTAMVGGYDIQAAFYLKLWHLTHKDEVRPLGFMFVPQEKHDPYDYEQWGWVEESDELRCASNLVSALLEDVAAWKSRCGDETPTAKTGGRDHTPHTIHWRDWEFSTRLSQLESLGGEM